jgi:hypothetical protein
MIYQICLLVLAIPVGFLIAWLCRDELLSGRVWFRVLIIVSILSAIYFYLIGNSVITFSCLFILIISLVSFIKSFDKKWTKRRV